MKGDFARDAAYMIKCIEVAHPIFIVDGMLPENYSAVRDEFLEYAQGEISRQDFVFAAHKYVAVLKDGHMSTWFTERHYDGKLWGVRFSDFLDVGWKVSLAGQLILDDGPEVKYIGGAAVADVFALIDKYFYPENDVDRQRNYEMYARYGTLIEMAGGEVVNKRVELTLDTGMLMAELSIDDLQKVNTYKKHDYIIRHEMMGDMFYIDLRSFTVGPHITRVANEIKKAVSGGTRKFIVDLRGNSGGNSDAGSELLAAMGITGGSRYGRLQRYSKLLGKGFWKMGYIKFGLIYFVTRRFMMLKYPMGQLTAPSIDTKNPNNVYISVLTDALTYSSATMMGVWVQDGKLGNIVGSPSRNAVSSFGDMGAFITLPRSKIGFMLSSVRFLRPDGDADPNMLRPNIVTSSADALEAALKHLQRIQGLMQGH